MAGVSENYRNRGIMGKLLSTLEMDVEKFGYRVLTVNTYRQIFPAMFHLLQKRGFQVYRENVVYHNGKEQIKNYLKKDLRNA